MTASAVVAFTVWWCRLRAQASFCSSRPTATMVDAPASRAPAIAASPTPPQPITATESPRLTLPVLIAAPRPAITPHPISPAAAGSTFVRCPGVNQGLLGKRADAERSSQLCAVGECQLLAGLKGRNSLRAAVFAGLAAPAGRPPVQHDEIADFDGIEARADTFDRACGLVVAQEQEFVVGAASRQVRSVWQTPHAAIATTTSPPSWIGMTISVRSRPSSSAPHPRGFRKPASRRCISAGVAVNPAWKSSRRSRRRHRPGCELFLHGQPCRWRCLRLSGGSRSWRVCCAESRLPWPLPCRGRRAVRACCARSRPGAVRSVRRRVGWRKWIGRRIT